MLELIAVANLVLLLVVLVVVWLRRPAAAAAEDPRLGLLLGADLPGILARADARGEGLERHLRAELAQLREENAAEAGRSRQAAEAASKALREEVLGNIKSLGETLHTGLDRFRGDNKAEAERLRGIMDGQLAELTRRFGAFTADTLQRGQDSRDALHRSLAELGAGQTLHQEKLREAVEERLNQLNKANSDKLEEMRRTVDEKLHDTLQTRLTASFGAVTDQLTKVYSSLGEMTKLSAGVDDLSRIFTNVKSRGGFAEVQLGMLLQQMLAPSQFRQNVRVKPNTQEVVEYAVKFPTPTGETLLPIDAKFPREAWERLETAYSSGENILSAGKAFEAAIRTEGKRICEKYIAPPVTTSFAVMFLPTEGLYAEVMRRDGLQTDIQQNCRVTIAGPSTLSAILNSFQMGFHMLQMQEKGDEVWKILAGTKKEFNNLGLLMTKMEKQVDTVQNTIQDVGRRTRAIDKRLGDVGTDTTEAALGAGASGAFDGLLPMLSASEEE